MVKIRQIDTFVKSDVNRFVEFHYSLYRKCPQWVPPFKNDIKTMLNKEKHPFYEHSDAVFFLAEDGGEVVGRLAVMENKPFNQYHEVKKVQFYLFDAINSQEVANSLFNQGAEWALQRGMNEIVGPKGFSGFDGYGIQVEGFEHRQMMNMMNYNFDYYPALMEGAGFTKEVDFVSCYMARDSFRLPEKAQEIASRVRQKGTLEIKQFKNKSEIKKWAWKLGRAYNNTFINNWEYYPFTDREIQFLLDNLLAVIDPNLIKIITHKEEIIGFLLAFPDISAAMQRHGGNLTPWAIADFLLEMKRTQWVSLNGVGVLPEYHGRGGNALLYSEMVNTIQNYHFVHAEQTQMAETAVQVRKDMITIGAKPYKNHRIYHKTL